MLHAAAIGGFGLLASLGAQAQIIIKAPPVHHTAASKKFVRPADPKTILSRLPSFDPQFYSHLSPQQQAKVAKAAGTATQPFSPGIPQADLAKLLSKSNPAQIPTGIGMKAAAKPEAANPTLPVNFPGFGGTPFVPAALPSDSSVVVASLAIDVNKDGKMDLVTVQNAGTVNVLLGDGTFSDLKITSSVQPALLNDVYYIFATTADMNKDGYPDLVVTDEVNNAAFVYLNAKNGTFLPPVEYDFSFSTGAGFDTDGGGVGVGDINGDGYPDLVGVGFSVTTEYGYLPFTTSSIVSMLNNGDGTLSAALPEQTVANIPALVSTNFGQVILSDMNKDGKTDLIIPYSGYDDNFESIIGTPILLGNGNGTFAAFPSVPPEAPANLGTLQEYYYASDDIPDSFITADFNGDGNPDLLFSWGGPNVFLALGNGDGTLQVPTLVVSNDGTYTNGGSSLVQYADVNGDGNLDIIGYDAGFMAVFLGQGGGVFAQTPLVQLLSGSGGLAQPLPADFNGDGKPDLVEVDQYLGRAGFYPQTNGTFSGITPLAPPTETVQSFAPEAIGDINGDGIPDVIATDFSRVNATDFTNTSDVVAGINDGKGNLTYQTLLSGALLSSLQLYHMEPFAVDLNGDGKADLIFSNGYTPYVSLSQPDGTYATPVGLKLPNTPACQLDVNSSIGGLVDVGDINGDGFPDIVVAYTGDSLCYPYTGPTPSGFYTFLNNRKGGFTSTFTPFGLTGYLVKLADLNGDGKLDLVFTDYNATNLIYYMYDVPGNGDGTFNVAGSQYVMENTVVASIIPGDFDGDGKNDLIVGVISQADGNGVPVYGTTGTYALKGNGDMTFQLPVIYTPGNYPLAGAYGDFNGDGRPDLALILGQYGYDTNVPVGNASTLINLGGGAFTPGPTMFTASTVGATGVFTADMNGDGAVDALFSPLLEKGYNGLGLAELFLNQGGIGFSLTSSAATVAQDSNVTLTATLTPTVGSQTPTGTVTFYDNGTSLGSVAVSGGTATFTLSALPVGTDAITASYSGDSHFNAATASTAVKVTVSALAPAFTLTTPTPVTIPVVQGQSGVATFNIAANATFSGNVTFTCTGAPAESSCTVSPATVTLTGGQTATLSAVVATTIPNNTYQAANRPADWMKTVGGISFAGLFLLFLPRARRTRRGIWTMVVMVGLGLTLMTGLTGCGGSGNKYAGTPAGTSTLTITATSGTLSQSTTFTVTVSN
jgi:hypothetical protein